MNYSKNFMMTTVKKLITHNGSFHTDDIFACAALILYLEKKGKEFSAQGGPVSGWEIIRTRDPEIIKTGDFIFDVGEIYDRGKNRFDHHQIGGAGRRSNEIEYSSLGLIWEKFGAEICENQKVADLIDKKLVAPIDAFDNGFDLVENKHEVSPYLIQHIFFAMEPTWREENANKDEIFLKCVEIAKNILRREIIQARDTVLAEELLADVYRDASDKRIIVLEQNYPFEYILHNFPEPLFAVYPRKTDQSWGIKAIRKNPKTFTNRKNFPKSWAGLRDLELQKITGISDAIFCHKGLFLAGAKSKEGAIALAQLALQDNLKPSA
ncbi:MAG: MYG1 family protein [Patescibacteria group bacterium]